MFRLGLVLLWCGCSNHLSNSANDLSSGNFDLSSSSDGGGGPCGTPAECAAAAEQRTSDHFDAITGDAMALTAFLVAVPKGGDLHNHLSGAIYAETYLDWAKSDGDCINPTSFAAVFSSQCASNMPVPMPGSFYDQIVAAWSMQGFVAGAESGHDHFFATFGKYGAVAGAHRDDTLADLVKRAAMENQLYIETMFNLGKNGGSLGASVWSGTLTAADLQNFYTMLTTNAGFAGAISSDAAVVTDAAARYKATLGCSNPNPPAACGVGLRFVAQVSRTGGNDTIFGQLVSAFEMAKTTPQIVAANLSSPEDDTTSLKNYDLHMAMLDFLHTQYAGKSPLHVTLHAGELVPKFLPAAYPTANTYHVRSAVETAHAERIGHGVDVLSEMNPDGLLDEMKTKNVLVEVCLSSNDQILEVKGSAHPLAQYLAHGVPVALATDDQGVSRSSLAGEYSRAVTDQKLGYRQLKKMARDSLEHSFLPGASLWMSLGVPVDDCAAIVPGDSPDTGCTAFLAASERATMQWELEKRFLAFEKQP